MKSFLVFARRFEDFHRLRDSYRDTAQDGPDPDKLKALTAAGKAVLDAAPAYVQLAEEARILGFDPPPEADLEAALDEVRFVVDPRGFLLRRGSYETSVDGKPVVLTEIDGQVIAVQGGAALEAALGPEHVGKGPFVQ